MFNPSQPARCAFCGEPFPFPGDDRAPSWPIADTYACNEFCADGAEDRPQGSLRTDLPFVLRGD